MTLFVKGTDTALVGIKVNAEAIQLVSGLTDDGYPILGEVVLMLETPDFELRNNSVMYITAEGDTYPDKLVVDLRDDGSEVAAIRQPPARPVTVAARETWRQEVLRHETLAGLHDWVEGLTDPAYFAAHGLYLSERDPMINRAFEGKWQIAEHYEPGTETETAQDGPWAIVGDDRQALVAEGYQQIRAFYQLHE
jgi:hypothetical protein